MIRICLRSIVAGALLVGVLAALPSQWAAAQPAPSAPLPISPGAAQQAAQVAPDAPMQISWEVRNRFRLFREERDFLLHTESARGRSVLASEQALELQSDGRGWARNTVNRLCIDLQGRVSEPCTRDNVKESYLTPIDHPVTVRLTGEVPVGATCAWSFDDGDGPQASTFDCAEPVNLRVRYGRTTVATVDVSSGPEAPQRLSTEITVRDLFIAGLGDSIASGEGNPDRAIALSDEGFCFRYYLGSASAQYYRPSRAGYQGRTGLRSAGHAAELAAPERAVVQFRLSPLAVQLSDPHRAGARGSISAHRGDLSAARLHRRHHPRRAVRLATRARMPADEIRPPTARARSTRNWPNCATRWPPRRSVSPTASSIWCCCRSAPTTSISPDWSPTSSSTRRPSACCSGAAA